MAKDIDLLSYWMPVLRKIKEFKEIAKTEEPELRYILEAIDRTISNFFITTADEYGISRFESMMGIFPEDGDTLDTRRFNVLIKWNDKVPYTEEELYNRLLSLCGSKDKFSIIPHYEEYGIEIITQLGIRGGFDAVTSLLLDMLPCNLVLDLKNLIKAEKTTPLYAGVAISTAMGYQITHDINSKVAKETSLNNAVAVSKASSEIITHDVGIKDSLQADIKGALGVGMAYTTLITHDLESKATGNGNYTAGTPVSTATVVTIKS